MTSLRDPSDVAAPARAGAGRRAIVHVVRQFHPNRGGLEDFVSNLVLEQVRRGHTVRVVTLDRLFGAPDVVLPGRDTHHGAEVVRIPWRGSSRYPLAFGFAPHLADAGLVHVHAIDFFFDAVALWRRFHRRPTVATTHGGFFHTGAHARLKELWFAGPTRFSAHAYDAVVACGAADADRFAPIAGDRLVRIDNGVDLSKFAERASPVATRSLVTIGRFSSNKRIDRLLDALRVLVDRDARWRLTIVGVAADLDGDDLRREIAGRGLEGAVDLRVDLDNDAVAATLADASLFVSASQFEGFGIALIEAASAGLVPVVHRNESFVRLAVEHPGVVLTDFADPARAADAITAAHHELETRGETLRAALAASVADYAWPRVAERYEAVYRRAGWVPAL